MIINERLPAYVYVPINGSKNYTFRLFKKSYNFKYCC